MRSAAAAAAISGALVWATPAAQQTPPSTEVFLATLTAGRTPEVTGPAVNISNNPGYDNQPGFLPDGSAVLFSSNRDGEQMDIFRYDLASRRLTQVTRTSEGEYSPTVTPDGRTFSVIRTEVDGRQRLWRFDPDGSNPRLVLEDVAPVGYHAWIDDTRLALFILGADREPATLQLADTATGTARVIEPRIGRSILRRPGGGTISFVSKPADGPWVVKELDPASGTVTPLVETVGDNAAEDCAWDPVSGWLLMAQGSTVWGWQPGGEWQPLGDLAGAGVGRITRLAVNPNPAAAAAVRLAVVGEPAAR